MKKLLLSLAAALLIAVSPLGALAAHQGGSPHPTGTPNPEKHFANQPTPTPKPGMNDPKPGWHPSPTPTPKPGMSFHPPTATPKHGMSNNPEPSFKPGMGMNDLKPGWHPSPTPTPKPGMPYHPPTPTPKHGMPNNPGPNFKPGMGMNDPNHGWHPSPTPTPKRGMHDGPGPDPYDGSGERHPDFRPGPNNYQLQKDARNVIVRTASVLVEAERAALRGGRNAGLALAMAHQRKARELYGARLYRDAIRHSLRARNIALQIIGNNRGRIGQEFWPNEWERRYYSGGNDAELDRRLNRGQIGLDRDAVHIRIELDI